LGTVAYNVDMNRPKFNAERKAAYVEALEKTGELVAAAAAVGFSRQCIYTNLNKDPQFAEECEKAKGRLYGRLMDAMDELSLKGHRTDHFAADGVTKTHSTYKKDTKLLLAWLKRTMPSKWSDKLQIDQTVTTKVQPIEPKDVPREARNRLREALAAMPPGSPSEN